MIAKVPGIQHNRTMNAVASQASPGLVAPIPPLVLASGSQARAALLRAAGLVCEIVPAGVDEAEFKAAARAAGAGADEVASSLAELKALRRSRQSPDALVIAADQMLSCDGRWFDKPEGSAAARQQLLALRGRTHELHSAVCVGRGGSIAWRHRERARLTMRDFSDAFLDAYLAAAGDAVADSVGGYQLEGLGAQLFAAIEGDYFAILGLPLLPLLAFLRQHGVLLA